MRKIWVVVVLGTVALLSACAPTAEPEPFHLPTATASRGSDDVADAIAVYEAYVAATNRLVVADEGTWDAVLRLLNGEMQTQTQGAIERQKDQGTVLSGDYAVTLVEKRSESRDRVLLNVCLDVSQTDLLDSSGRSIADPNRSPFQALAITVDRIPGSAGESAQWKITHVAQRADGPTCS